MGVGIVSRHGNIDRIIQREGCVNDAAIKVSVSAVAGVVAPLWDVQGIVLLWGGLLAHLSKGALGGGRRGEHPLSRPPPLCGCRHSRLPRLPGTRLERTPLYSPDGRPRCHESPPPPC